ncbi:MAG: nicotinate-nucleotide adenylyltransferase [Acidobacteriota bacterium]|nr:nicotinate-nucleotide adenylyltransferase [Acidobacteriota bacterium]
MSGFALFGGTFDPIHDAHLRIAGAAANRCGLDRVLFIPSAQPPHRAEGAFASFEDRYAMVALACGEDARFEPSRLEEAAVTSYSIHTIDAIRAELPGVPLHFLIGADAFAEIRTWFRWQDVVASVTFIVVSRPGAAYDIPGNARVVRLEEINLSISSSEIRRKLARGDSDVPVPASVRLYIETHKLYRAIPC